MIGNLPGPKARVRKAQSDSVLSLDLEVHSLSLTANGRALRP